MTPDGNAPWYATAFGEDYLRAFAPAFAADRTADEVDGVEALAGMDGPCRVLDLACGQGRHAVALAERGHAVTGLDRSAALLPRAAASAGGESVRWVRGDLRALPLRDGSVDVVIHLFNGFGYLEDDTEDLRGLAEVARVLAPDGLLLQEVLHRDGLMRAWEPVTATRLDDRTVLVEEHAFDLRTDRHTVAHTLVADGEPARHFGTSQRVYTLAELLRMHRAAGLVPETVAGSLVDGGEPDLDDALLVIRSRRRT